MNPEGVHKLAGALILVFVALEFAKDAGWLRGGWQNYLVPIGLLAFGLFLVLDRSFSTGVSAPPAIAFDPFRAPLCGVPYDETRSHRDWQSIKPSPV